MFDERRLSQGLLSGNRQYNQSKHVNLKNFRQSICLRVLLLEICLMYTSTINLNNFNPIHASGLFLYPLKHQKIEMKWDHDLPDR